MPNLQGDTPTPKAETSWDSCPSASFSILNNGVDTATPINFSNHSIGADSYHWDFGDGQFSCAANPSHVYSNPGTYVVKLRASFDGCMVEFIGTEDVLVF